MKNIALKYGAIAGVVIIGTMILSIVLASEGGTSEIFGYTVMLLALSLIFIGIKRYRDFDHGGLIRFGPAFLMGLAITLVAGVIYVGAWEVYLAATDHAFIDDYVAASIDKVKADGVTGAALEEKIVEMEKMKAQYGKPWFRLPMTFLEIFPVGLLISLISAGLLRNPKFLAAGEQVRRS